MHAAVTGDMTLSLLDDSGFKVLGLDLLSLDAMRPGTNGERLAKALNNLTLLANAASEEEVESIAGDEGKLGAFSPLPWQCEVVAPVKKVTVVDRDGMRIADRRFPRQMAMDRFEAVVTVLESAVARVNGLEDSQQGLPQGQWQVGGQR